MTATNSRLGDHPAPRHDGLRAHESFFALFGGPIAWFVQLCGGFALASEPCFSGGERTLAPSAGAGWTWPAMVILLAAGVVIALISLLVSWRAFQRTQAESEGDHRHLMEVGTGRTRFLALWGMILGGGFALATIFTAVGFITLPRCAG